MCTGDILELVIDDGEPVETVPGSLAQEGHEILAKQRDGAHWRLFVRTG